MRKLLFILLLCATTVQLYGQSFPVPDNYSLKTKDDYPKYEQDVIKTIDWIQMTPWSDQKENRKIADRFVLAWISGSPNINLDINADGLMKMCTKNGELLFSFMGGYVKYALQNKDAKYNFNVNEANLAGLRAIISKYSSEPDHKKDKNVENITQLDKDDKLADWAKINLKTS